jgi:hypothetical protein
MIGPIIASVAKLANAGNVVMKSHQVSWSLAWHRLDGQRKNNFLELLTHVDYFRKILSAKILIL